MTESPSFQELPAEPLHFWIGALLVVTFLAAVVYIATSGPLRARTSCEDGGGVYISRFGTCEQPVPGQPLPR